MLEGWRIESTNGQRKGSEAMWKVAEESIEKGWISMGRGGIKRKWTWKGWRNIE